MSQPVGLALFKKLKLNNMYAPIIIRNNEFPESYHLLLGDYKKLIREYNLIVSKMESLENEVEWYRHRNHMGGLFESEMFFP